MVKAKVLEKDNKAYIVVKGINEENFNNTVVEVIKVYTCSRNKLVLKENLKKLQQAFFECVRDNKPNKYFKPTTNEHIIQFNDIGIEYEIFNNSSIYNDEDLIWY